MHRLALGAFSHSTKIASHPTTSSVLMHRLALGAFSHTGFSNYLKTAYSLNAPFGARCFLTGDMELIEEKMTGLS